MSTSELNEPTSELNELLERLYELEEEETKHGKKHKFLKPSPRYTIALTPAQKVLWNRTKARLRSAALLCRCIQTTKSKTGSAQAPSSAPRPQGQEFPDWRLWLERLEKELLEDWTFLESEQEYIDEHPEAGRQLVAWQAELSLKNSQSMEALKLVLKFKAGKFTDSRALQVDCLERMSSPSFPQELRTMIVEAGVRTQISYCRIDQSISLAMVANKSFRKLPEHFEEDTRSLLKHMTICAIQKHSLIVIPATFTLQFTLATSPEIQQSGHLIRYLALDLFTQPRDGAHSRELNRGSKSLASLKQVFPNLESCIIMVHLGHNLGLATSRRITEEPGQQEFARGCLRFRNVIKANNIITLEKTLVELIAAFLERGPGKRKFVRLTHSDAREPGRRIVGPLVRASIQEPIDSLSPTPDLTSEEGRASVDAERVFQEAYWGKTGPLGDWAASYREQQLQNYV